METERSEFQFSVAGDPDYSFLTVQLPTGATLKVEASSMATMDTNLKMKTKLKGGFSRFLTGESLFINEFTAEEGPGEISIAPGPPGELVHQYLDNTTIFLVNSAYLASGMAIETATKWEGFAKGFFGSGSLFLIKCSGQGDLWFNSYGALIEVDVDGEYIVDNNHIVAFTEGLDYTINKIGGYKSLFLSQEGLICRFSGQGKVWVQTRKVAALGSWVYPFRRVKSNNN